MMQVLLLTMKHSISVVNNGQKQRELSL